MTRLNKQTIIQTQLTIDTNMYSANDVIGGLLTFKVHNSFSGGIIRWARIVDDDDEKAELALYLFHALPSTIADDAAFAPTIGDLKKLFGKITFSASGYETTNGNAFNIMRGSADDVDLDFYTDLENIFGYLVAVGTPTYAAATNLHLTLGVWLDG